MDAAEVRSLAHELEEMVGMVEGLLSAVEADGPAAHGARVQALVRALRARLADADLPAMLLRSHAEITDALGGIRLSREAIEATAIDRIHRGQARLDEVSSTTESAVMELMNGIERAAAHVERLAREAGAGGASEALRAGLDPLRDELNQLFGHLQFQDITAQQLQGVAELLRDAEERIGAVARLFDPESGGPAARRAARERHAYNPDATMRDVVSRQALADDVLRAAAGA